MVLPKDLDITIISTIVGSILAALGIMQDDVYLLIPAIIISPIGFVLNELSKDIINYRTNQSILNIMLFIFIIMCAVIIGLAFSKFGPELSEEKIRRYSNTNMTYHGLIGLMLGMYTAYITSVKDPSAVELPLVGVAIAITLLPPFVDMGLRLGQEKLDKKMIRSDFNIAMVNSVSFLAGAMGINYWMSQK